MAQVDGTVVVLKSPDSNPVVQQTRHSDPTGCKLAQSSAHVSSAVQMSLTLIDCSSLSRHKAIQALLDLMGGEQEWEAAVAS